MDTPLMVLVRRLALDPELTGPAALAALVIADDTLVITPDAGARPLILPLAALAGIGVRAHAAAPAALLVHPLRGVPLALQPRDESGRDDLIAVARRAERRAFALPELTRGLRAVGARRGVPGDDHDRWFGALLAARQRAARAGDWETRAAAFAGGPLRLLLEETVTGMAVVRYPASPPDQRALAAALEECASQLDEALQALTVVDGRLRAADDSRRLVAWRDWVAAARECFAAADRGWLAMAPLLARHAPATPPTPATETSPAGAGWWRRGGAGGRAR
ncbi:MAG: hypothetical protein ACYC2G_02480 [Gemmatimonadaceae bacterium]